MPDVDWTGRELRHMIERIEAKLDADTRKLDALTVQVTAMSASADAVHKRLAEQVEDLESWQTWALRIVVSAVVIAVLALVINDGVPAALVK